jgi:hypothetical protein
MGLLYFYQRFQTSYYASFDSITFGIFQRVLMGHGLHHTTSIIKTRINITFDFLENPTQAILKRLTLKYWL